MDDSPIEKSKLIFKDLYSFDGIPTTKDPEQQSRDQENRVGIEQKI